MTATYQVSRLPSGLTLATAAMPDMASVSLGLWVAVGGRYETAQACGASHFIEHMLFKGTRRRTSLEISEAVEGIGGYLNAFTTEENTCVFSKALHDRLPELLDVLADMLLHSTFEPQEVDKERQVIKEEIAMYLDQPAQHVQELLNELMWPDHPLGRPLTGTTRTLKGLGRPQLLDFLHDNYTAPNILVCAAGQVTHPQMLRAFRPYASKFRTGEKLKCERASEAQAAPAVRLFTKETAQTQIALGLRVCSRHDPRRYPLRLLNALLGENMSSRLFQVVREEHGLAYSIQSSTSLLEDVGALVISAGLEAGNISQVLTLVMRELKRLVDHAPTAAELRRTRDYLIGQLELGLEGTENQMTWVGEQLLGYGHVVPPGEIKRRLTRVTSAQIHAVARDFFRPELMNLAVVSPLKNAERLARLLRM